MGIFKLNLENTLRAFDDQDYILKKKAVFLYYFIWAAIFVTVALLFSTTIFQTLSYGKFRLATFIPLVVLILVFAYCLLILTKGKFSLSANILVLSSLIGVWTIIFLDVSSILTRTNTIVYIFAALSMLPLIVDNKKKIFLYGILNLLVLFVFILLLYYNRETYGFTTFEIRDTLTDTSLALVFSMIVHHFVYSINHIALENAKKEIQSRKKIAFELQYHKDNLELMVIEQTEELQAINEELQSNNEELFEKNDTINNKNIELQTALDHLKETQSHLLQADKMASLGTLTSGVAHEINNPLNYLMGSLVGLTNYFESHGSEDNEKTKIFLSSINTGIERISSIVQGLNQFSRNNESMDEDCDIHAIMDNCFVMLQSKTQYKVEVIKNYAGINIFTKGNVGKLHQVFLNIFTNSIHAIPKNGHIIAKTRIEHENIVIKIIDDGTGIEKEYLNQITNPFFTTKSPGQGTGLGLSLTYTIIKEHKGKIEFESKINEGTKVIITLPLKHDYGYKS